MKNEEEIEEEIEPTTLERINSVDERAASKALIEQL